MQDGFGEDLYEAVQQWRDTDGFTERERLAAEYAERFALDHTNLDDEFWARMRASYTDAEILELSMAIGTFISLGRTLAVLDVADECELNWAPGDAPPT
ncbi:MAG: carboxymuconolactone decarboxylase family protein [Acidimicrobiales bacterium]